MALTRSCSTASESDYGYSEFTQPDPSAWTYVTVLPNISDRTAVTLLAFLIPSLYYSTVSHDLAPARRAPPLGEVCDFPPIEEEEEENWPMEQLQRDHNAGVITPQQARENEPNTQTTEESTRVQPPSTNQSAKSIAAQTQAPLSALDPNYGDYKYTGMHSLYISSTVLRGICSQPGKSFSFVRPCVSNVPRNHSNGEGSDSFCAPLKSA
jgi:hypothetical protein